MSYDGLTFTFYSGDVLDIGINTFTIEAFLTNYPSLATAPQSQTTIIDVKDPCPNPDFVMKGAP